MQMNKRERQDLEEAQRAQAESAAEWADLNSPKGRERAIQNWKDLYAATANERQRFWMFHSNAHTNN